MKVRKTYYIALKCTASICVTMYGNKAYYILVFGQMCIFIYLVKIFTFHERTYRGFLHNEPCFYASKYFSLESYSIADNKNNNTIFILYVKNQSRGLLHQYWTTLNILWLWLHVVSKEKAYAVWIIFYGTCKFYTFSN